MKIYLIRTFISILVLAQFVVLGLYFRHTQDGVNALVKVSARSVYALPIGAKDTLFFDDVLPDSVRLISDKRTRVEQLRTVIGRRVSRENLVQATFVVRNKVLSGDKLHKMLLSYAKAEEKRVVSNEQHLKELAYYAKTHSVIDEGYNEVMRYREQLLQEHQDQVRAYQKLNRYLAEVQTDSGKHPKKLRAYRRMQYSVNGQVYQRTEDVGNSFFKNTDKTPRLGMLTLAPVTNEPQQGIDGKSLYAYLRPLHDTTHLEFTDSLGVHYRLQLVSSAPKIWSGTQLSPDGTYYEGFFNAQYQRHGQGFAVDHHIVKSGEWNENRYRGERMVYTPTRVYGIDVSRHQHEKGRKRYPIHWDRLRITHLGSISKKKVSGAVDYPVSFVFIKATEGKSLLNKYYLSDLRGARAQGIPVAPYHFFTHLSSGLAQARHFVKHVRLPLATLPPMLDVEPSNAQIAKMGGREVLFKEMLIWLHHVEQHSHHRPILYVSQQFVNQHLVHAPEALRKYDVWIARYGEFKPYVKLTFWQLSPDGRVRGIHGDVDINVYNGTKSDFHAWRNS